MTLMDHVARYVSLKRRLGYDYRTHAGILRQYARFADDRGDRVVRTATVTEWASAAVSRHQAARRLHFVHAFAVWMHAEDARHELPPRDFFGPHSNQRPPPDLITTQELRALLAAALCLEPMGTMSPLTWHYMLGLIASTGIRRCEAVALRLTDVTPHGLVIRESKFHKSRLVSLHPYRSARRVSRNSASAGDPGRSSLRARPWPRASSGHRVQSLPQARHQDGHPHRHPKAAGARSASSLRHTLAGSAGRRPRPHPAHARPGHLSRSCRSGQHLL